MKFDLLLCCAKKDEMKLPYVIKHALNNIDGIDQVFIIKDSPYMPNISEAKITIIKDKDALPGIDRLGWKHRPNWLWQQHCKMFQEITSDWWLTIDCDTVINRKIPIFSNNKPIQWIGTNQNHAPYFKFSELMLGFGKIHPKSFITDMNLFHRPIINEILCSKGYTRETFIKRSQEISSRSLYMGEPELYGNYVMLNHPDMYEYRQLNMAPPIGLIQNPGSPNVWNEAEVRDKIEEFRNTDYDSFSMHSWFMEEIW